MSELTLHATYGLWLQFTLPSATLYLVLVDLKAHKCTTTILQSLQAAYPRPRNVSVQLPRNVSVQLHSGQRAGSSWFAAVHVTDKKFSSQEEGT